ncbi:hypothetical protein Tco_1232705, partial [Tanacetum coccineum]
MTLLGLVNAIAKGGKVGLLLRISLDGIRKCSIAMEDHSSVCEWGYAFHDDAFSFVQPFLLWVLGEWL